MLNDEVHPFRRLRHAGIAEGKRVHPVHKTSTGAQEKIYAKQIDVLTTESNPWREGPDTGRSLLTLASLIRPLVKSSHHPPRPFRSAAAINLTRADRPVRRIIAQRQCARERCESRKSKAAFAQFVPFADERFRLSASSCLRLRRFQFFAFFFASLLAFLAWRSSLVGGRPSSAPAPGSPPMSGLLSLGSHLASSAFFAAYSVWLARLVHS